MSVSLGYSFRSARFSLEGGLHRVLSSTNSMSNNSEQAESQNQTTAIENLRATVRTSIKRMETVSKDQYGLKTSLLTNLESTYMSTAASKEALIELFPSEIVAYYTNLKLPLLYQHLREIMRICGLVSKK